MKKPRANIPLREDVSDLLNIAAIKTRCPKADFVEGLLKVSFGLPPDDAISHYLVQLGAQKLAIDLSRITEAEASAKRPRGSPLKPPRGGRKQSKRAGKTGSAAQKSGALTRGRENETGDIVYGDKLVHGSKTVHGGQNVR